MAIFDKQPQIFESNGDGSFTYRWGIQEIEIPPRNEGQDPEMKYECNEVIIWATVTKDKITKAVINSLWDNDKEQKFLNDFNAANAGIYGPVSEFEAQKKIAAYMDFLEQRKSVKDLVSSDCLSLNIQ